MDGELTLIKGLRRNWVFGALFCIDSRLVTFFLEGYITFDRL